MKIFFRDVYFLTITRFLYVLVLLLILTGCAPKLKIIFQDPAFSMGLLKKESCVVMATPKAISMYDFQKTFIQTYQTNEQFMTYMVDDVALQLKSSGLNVIGDNTPEVYTKFLNDSAKYVSSNRAKYIVCIRGVSVDQTIVPIGVYRRATLCTIVIEIVIMNVENKKLVMSYSVSKSAKVNLFAYEMALRTAVERTKNEVIRTFTEGVKFQYGEPR